jgi:hypothetical protein
MNNNTSFKTLPVGRSGKVALVDAGDYLRLSQYKWNIGGGSGYIVRWRTIAGRRQRITLQREILREPRGLIRFVNGNPLDCRRANLRLCEGGSISLDRRSKRRPFACGSIWMERSISSAGGRGGHGRKRSEKLRRAWLKSCAVAV